MLSFGDAGVENEAARADVKRTWGVEWYCPHCYNSTHTPRGPALPRGWQKSHRTVGQTIRQNSGEMFPRDWQMAWQREVRLWGERIPPQPHTGNGTASIVLLLLVLVVSTAARLMLRLLERLLGSPSGIIIMLLLPLLDGLFAVFLSTDASGDDGATMGSNVPLGKGIAAGPPDELPTAGGTHDDAAATSVVANTGGVGGTATTTTFLGPVTLLSFSCRTDSSSFSERLEDSPRLRLAVVILLPALELFVTFSLSSSAQLLLLLKSGI